MGRAVDLRAIVKLPKRVHHRATSVSRSLVGQAPQRLIRRNRLPAAGGAVEDYCPIGQKRSNEQAHFMEFAGNWYVARAQLARPARPLQCRARLGT